MWYFLCFFCNFNGYVLIYALTKACSIQNIWQVGDGHPGYPGSWSINRNRKTETGKEQIFVTVMLVGTG